MRSGGMIISAPVWWCHVQEPDFIFCDLTQDRRFAALKGFPYFAQLQPSELRGLVRICPETVFKKEAEICREGDVADWCVCGAHLSPLAQY
eukprot:SAG11_NODE_171_length_13596_cov_15.767356_7_plen_91_part_00